MFKFLKHTTRCGLTGLTGFNKIFVKFVDINHDCNSLIIRLCLHVWFAVLLNLATYLQHDENAYNRKTIQCYFKSKSYIHSQVTLISPTSLLRSGSNICYSSFNTTYCFFFAEIKSIFCHPATFLSSHF